MEKTVLSKVYIFKPKKGLAGFRKSPPKESPSKSTFFYQKMAPSTGLSARSKKEGLGLARVRGNTSGSGTSPFSTPLIP